VLVFGLLQAKAVGCHGLMLPSVHKGSPHPTRQDCHPDYFIIHVFLCYSLKVKWNFESKIFHLNSFIKKGGNI
jgi:hypothetical protein